jgi:hypothetical protein
MAENIGVMWQLESDDYITVTPCGECHVFSDMIAKNQLFVATITYYGPFFVMGGGKIISDGDPIKLIFKINMN